ncbi:hypothetical protein [Mesorhizobium sp. WSM3868]|uniref:hypothetical protein n=1 Tax=Mesorhizobium sp. WSM3868 TaxID=2029405 RepID=UPI001FDED767|nr:hypothetical protein [Mesorhizobium sp. WSM3868]
MTKSQLPQWTHRISSTRGASHGGSQVIRLFILALSGIGLLYSSASALAEEHERALAEETIPALAEECAAPCAGYEATAELQNDWIFGAHPSFLRSDVFFPKLELDLFYAPTDYLRFVSAIITEPVVDPEPGENAAFQGIGTYVGELYALAKVDPLTVRAGKFDTVFSLASEALPGIHAPDLASVFDADERLGGEAVVGFEGFGLNNALAATVFTTDRTFLSESLFTNRGRTTLADGGAGNTTGLSSFSVTLDGCKGAEKGDCYKDGEFGYRLGIRYQKPGLSADTGEEEEEEEEEEPLPGTGNELAYLAAATGSFDLNGNTLRLLGESAYLKHFDGGPDDALLLTGSVALEVQPMTYIATYTQQRNFVADGPDTREQLADFEVIYASGEEDAPSGAAKWNLGAGYTFAENAEDERTHTFSVRATLQFGGHVKLGR